MTTTTRSNNAFINNSGVATTEICGTKKEIEQAEKAGSNTSTGYSGGVTVTTATNTKCMP